MVIPPETHFFHSHDALDNQFQDTKLVSLRDRLISFWYSQKTRIRDLGLKEDEVREHAEVLGITKPDELFNLQLTLYRKKRSKGIVGEKTPRHILQVDEILNVYPKAKIISMFRDPRAAAWSEIKAHFGSPSVLVTTRRWRSYVEMHEQLHKRLAKDQYMMLRYQDLIEEPEHRLKEICSFLGVNFEQQMLEYHQRDEEGFAEGEKSWKKGTLQPIQKNKNEEWKEELTPWQVTLVENMAGEHLQKMDYEKSGESLSFPKKLFYQCIDFSKSIWATLTKARHEGYKDPRKKKF
jgi:hypothetical protein